MIEMFLAWDDKLALVQVSRALRGKGLMTKLFKSIRFPKSIEGHPALDRANRVESHADGYERALVWQVVLPMRFRHRASSCSSLPGPLTGDGSDQLDLEAEVERCTIVPNHDVIQAKQRDPSLPVLQPEFVLAAEIKYAPFVWPPIIQNVSFRGCEWLTPVQLRTALLECPLLERLDLSYCAQLRGTLQAVFTPGRVLPVVDVPSNAWSCKHLFDEFGNELDEFLDCEVQHVASNEVDSDSSSGCSSVRPASRTDAEYNRPEPKVQYSNDLSCARCKFLFDPKPSPKSVAPTPPRNMRRVFLYGSKSRTTRKAAVLDDVDEPLALESPVVPPPRALFPHLTSLDLSWTGLCDGELSAVAITCPSLRSVSLFRCPDVTDLSVVYLARYCRQLRSLDFTTCVRVTDIGIATLAQHCPLLEDLRLNGTGKFLPLREVLAVTTIPQFVMYKDKRQLPPVKPPPNASQHELALASKVHKPKRLNVASTVGISDACFVLFQMSRPVWPLRRLELKASCISDVTIDVLSDMCGPTLRWLDVSACADVTDAGLATIVWRFTRLRRLIVKLTKECRITDAGIVTTMRSLPPACECEFRTISAKRHPSAALPEPYTLAAVAFRSVTSHTNE
jgi:hypothetical protein